MKKILIILTFLSSCTIVRKADLNDLKSLNDFLLNTINCEEVYQVHALEIADQRIYSFLNIAINEAIDCEQHDSRFKYLHSFEIFPKKIKNGFSYKIYLNRSVKDALNIFFRFERKEGALEKMGGFYYKNYLFTVNLKEAFTGDHYTGQFFSKTDCYLNINATNLPDSRSYNSFIEIQYQDDTYELLDSQPCGEQILITK